MDECRLMKPELAMEAEILAYRAAMQVAGALWTRTGSFVTESAWRRGLRITVAWKTLKPCRPTWWKRSNLYMCAKRTGALWGCSSFGTGSTIIWPSYGGHIGYSVPEERKKSMRSGCWQDGLRHCGALGLTHVLITCKVENEGSRRDVGEWRGV